MSVEFENWHKITGLSSCTQAQIPEEYELFVFLEIGLEVNFDVIGYLQ
jgi:hypothetical protein